MGSTENSVVSTAAADIRAAGSADNSVVSKPSEPKPPTGLHAAMRELLQPEALRGAERYDCSRCKAKVDAERGVALCELPRVLAIQLKRFRFDHRLRQRYKVSDAFPFPIDLDMGAYLSPNGSTGASYAADEVGGGAADGVGGSVAELDGGNRVEDADGGTLVTSTLAPYDLFGVLVHSGAAGFGHYYSLLRDLVTDEWHEFNDSRVSPMKVSDLEKYFGGSESNSYTPPSAYMLLYRARASPAAMRDCDSGVTTWTTPSADCTPAEAKAAAPAASPAAPAVVSATAVSLATELQAVPANLSASAAMCGLKRLRASGSAAGSVGHVDQPDMCDASAQAALTAPSELAHAHAASSAVAAGCDAEFLAEAETGGEPMDL